MKCCVDSRLIDVSLVIDILEKSLFFYATSVAVKLVARTQ